MCSRTDHFEHLLERVSTATTEKTSIKAGRRICRDCQTPNVYVKLGGLAMPDNGFRWHQAQIPPSSDEIIAEQEQYYLHMIDSSALNAACLKATSRSTGFPSAITCSIMSSKNDLKFF